MKLSKRSTSIASGSSTGALAVVMSISLHSESILTGGLISPSPSLSYPVATLLTLNLYAVAGLSPPKDIIPSFSNLPVLVYLFTSVCPSRSSNSYVPSFSGSSVIAHCTVIDEWVTSLSFTNGASICGTADLSLTFIVFSANPTEPFLSVTFRETFFSPEVL